MPFLSFRGITKRFPGVLALDGVSFDIERGSCHALVGENGAGKSTLGKILAGVYVADEGEILIEGQPFQASTPLAARKQATPAGWIVAGCANRQEPCSGRLKPTWM